MRASDQEGAFEEEAFREGLAAHLRDGSFRVVIVLDEAPPGLVRLAGYLETIADRIAGWADGLESNGLARVRSTVGKNGDRWTLLLSLPGEETSIATGWNERGRASLAVYRSVVERAATSSRRRRSRSSASR